MRTRQMVENRKYKIFKDDYQFYFAIRKRGRISFWLKSEIEEKKIYEGFFTEINLLLKSYNSYYDCEGCYLFLEDINNLCSIFEIIDNKIVKIFGSHELRKIYTMTNEKKERDVVIIICNKEKKIYSIWSILRGDIFGPYEYTGIENYNYGVLLDKVIAVEDNGCNYNISHLNRVCDSVYYDKNNEGYMFLVDEDDSLFKWMERDEEDENLYKIETNDNIYTFNSETQELDCKFLPRRDDDYDDDLSKYSDVAYEGYSRLYLGLDD